MQTNFTNKQGTMSRAGYSLIELIVYLAIFSALSVLIVSSLVTVMRTYATAQSYRRLQNAGGLIMERIIRESRNASSTTASSVFGSNPGTLSLSGTDTSGTAKTEVFSVVSGALQINDNGTVGTLSTSDTTVTSLIFRKISTSAEQGVKVELILTTTSGVIESAPFYATIMFRS